MPESFTAVVNDYNIATAISSKRPLATNHADITGDCRQPSGEHADIFLLSRVTMIICILVRMKLRARFFKSPHMMFSLGNRSRWQIPGGRRRWLNESRYGGDLRPE
jgi:hypothetical protein